MKIFGRLAALLLVLAAAPAFAAVTCSVSVTSISTNYAPTASTDTIVTGSFSVSCTRLASDANTFNWSLGADNGQHASGQVNGVALNGALYSYELYRTPHYANANRWRDNTAGNRLSGNISFGASLTGSQNGSFDLRLPAPQTVQAAGTYTDLVTVTLRDASTSSMLGQNTFNVSVITTPTCSLSTPPGSVSFTYTSFQPGSASASTSFGVICTTALPYTMSLDATSGTLVGLSYSLALSQNSGSGTGAAQTYSINGSIAAGQAGTCSAATCSASEIRTLTITY